MPINSSPAGDLCSTVGWLGPGSRPKAPARFRLLIDILSIRRWQRITTRLRVDTPEGIRGAGTLPTAMARGRASRPLSVLLPCVVSFRLFAVGWSESCQALPLQRLRHPDLAPSRLLDRLRDGRLFDLNRGAVLQHWFAPADLLQRQLAAFIVQLFKPVKAVSAVCSPSFCRLG